MFLGGFLIIIIYSIEDVGVSKSDQNKKREREKTKINILKYFSRGIWNVCVCVY